MHHSSQFEPVFLYLFAMQHKLSKQHNLKIAKQNLEQSKMRIAEIDCVLTKLYEDNAPGEITDEHFEKFKHRRVKIDIYFTAVGLISIPDEKELLALMDEIRNEKVRKNGLSGATAIVTPLIF